MDLIERDPTQALPRGERAAVVEDALVDEWEQAAMEERPVDLSAALMGDDPFLRKVRADYAKHHPATPDVEDEFSDDYKVK